MVTSYNKLKPPPHGAISNSVLSSAIFFIVRKEGLEELDVKAQTNYKGFLQDKRKYKELEEKVASGVLKLTDRWNTMEEKLGRANRGLGKKKDVTQAEVAMAEEVVMEEDVMEKEMGVTLEEGVVQLQGAMEEEGAESFQGEEDMEVEEGRVSFLSAVLESADREEMVRMLKEMVVEASVITNGLVMELQARESLSIWDIAQFVLHSLGIPDASREQKQRVVNCLAYTSKRVASMKADPADPWIYLDSCLSATSHPLDSLIYKLKSIKAEAVECLQCGEAATSYCRYCLMALYCGRSCQSQHWQEEHGSTCMAWGATLHQTSGLLPPAAEAPKLASATRARRRCQERVHQTMDRLVAALDQVEEDRLQRELLEKEVEERRAQTIRLGRTR